MFHLPPPPPRFTLPPPPMLSSDMFDTELLFRLTCSSLRQQHRPLVNSHLILFTSIIFLLLILLFLIAQFYRLQKSLFHKHKSKLSSGPPSNNLSLNSNRSYETISSKHTGICVESINTSATTYSTDPSNIPCLYYHQDRDYSSISSLSPYYHTLNILPS